MLNGGGQLLTFGASNFQLLPEHFAGDGLGLLAYKRSPLQRGENFALSTPFGYFIAIDGNERQKFNFEWSLVLKTADAIALASLLQASIASIKASSNANLVLRDDRLVLQEPKPLFRAMHTIIADKTNSVVGFATFNIVLDKPIKLEPLFADYYSLIFTAQEC